MEMVVQGVSTRKVTEITEELCGTSFSKSTIFEICKGSDKEFQQWKERLLNVKAYPFVVVNTTTSMSWKKVVSVPEAFC